MNWRNKIRNADCELCPLHESAEHVCLMGSGKRKSKIMIVGEAPGAREDETHQAFVGQSGQLLREYLVAAGISPDECYITNCAKCRPPDNRTPDKSELRICSEMYLSQEIAAVQPDWVLLLGNAALQTVVRRSGITTHRGSIYELGSFRAFAAYHPAYVLRNPRHGIELRADLERFSRLVHGEAAKAKPTKVRIVRSKEGLVWLREQLMVATQISYDIETTGLDEWVEDAKIVSISFTWEEGQAAVVPIEHATLTPGRGRPILQFLKPCLERGDCKYIAHNGKFDSRWLAHFGVFVPQTFDTMLAAHMLDENRAKGLKPLSQVLLGVDAYDIGEDVRRAFEAPLKRLCVYNGKDTDYTLRLKSVFTDELKQEPRVARVFMKLMMPASNAITKMERVGIYVDQQRLKKITTQVQLKKQETYDELMEWAPQGINFNSPQQVGRWLFGDLGLPILLETKTGAASTNESVMLQLASQHPAPAKLLELRKYTKYLNTYLEPWAEHCDTRSRIHANYKLFGTVTGRLSCEKPNLQQVPRDSTMRTVFGAPKGWVFVEADYSQVELRIAAMLSNERTMLRAFAMGEDIHLKTAVEVSGKLPSAITKEERKKAKAVNFGFLYGMGWEKFVMYARDNYGVEVTDAEAQATRRRFFESYPALLTWHDRQRRLANRYQRVHSPIGRVRHLSDIASGDKGVRAEAERQAINSPAQSFASDLMLLSLVRLDERLPARSARIVGSVHDALLFEVRRKACNDVLPVIRSTMQDTTHVKRLFGADVTVPIEVEISVGSHWGEGTVWND